MNLFSRNDDQEVFNHMEITLQVIFVYLTLLRLCLNLCGQDIRY